MHGSRTPFARIHESGAGTSAGDATGESVERDDKGVGCVPDGRGCVQIDVREAVSGSAAPARRVDECDGLTHSNCWLGWVDATEADTGASASGDRSDASEGENGLEH